MSEGIYSIVKGDVLNDSPPGPKIIPHICNDVGAWGAGFTAALDKKWPEVGEDFRQTRVGLCYVSSFIVESDIRVVNMVAQHLLPSKYNPRPLVYSVLVDCMRTVLDYDKGTTPIHCPKFGSGLAGGKWEFIEILIMEIWVNSGRNVTVYELE